MFEILSIIPTLKNFKPSERLILMYLYLNPDTHHSLTSLINNLGLSRQTVVSAMANLKAFDFVSSDYVVLEDNIKRYCINHK